MPKILVVDDQRNMRTTLAMLLRSAGYDVEEAADGNQGADMAARGAYDVVLTDLRMGQFDYIQKPSNEQELLLKVERANHNRSLARENVFLKSEFKEKYRFDNIVGRSQSVTEVLSRIAKVAPTDATVLITGESGTGKELVAKAIHANSKRGERPYVPVNCAAISETLLESELFGHSRGSFTGAVSARKGLFE